MTLSVVVALPAAADLAAVSRMEEASSTSPNAETTWYIPSVRLLVTTPVLSEMFRTSEEMLAVRDAISSAVPVSRVWTLDSSFL